MSHRHITAALLALAFAAHCSGCKSCNDGAQPAQPAQSAPTASTATAADASQATTPNASATQLAPPQASATLEGTNPFGCVGWSPATKQVACIEGHWGHNISGPTWALVLRSANAETSVDLSPGRRFPASGAVTDDPLPAAKLEAAKQRLTADGFVAIPAPTTLAVTKTELTAGASVTYERARESAGGDNQAPSYRERIIVHFGGNSEQVLHDANNVATGEPGPEVSMYRVGASTVVIYRRANIADEGQYEVEARAWYCDLAANRCR